MEFDRIAAGVLATQTKDPRLAPPVRFWIERFGDTDIASITPEMIDQAIEHVARQGKHRHIKGQGIVATGEPISGSTLNR
jgi:hypothetical protein